jgi:hypothetical protein
MPITSRQWAWVEQGANEAIDRDLFYCGAICLLNGVRDPSDQQVKRAISQALQVDQMRYPQASWYTTGKS